MIQLDMTCTVCGTRLTITQKFDKLKSKTDKHLLWCFKCGADRYFVNSDIFKGDEFFVFETENQHKKSKDNPRALKIKQMIVPSSHLIGKCHFTHHPMGMAWNMIHKKCCLKKGCKHFSWVDLSARDTYRKTHDTVKERKERRRRANMKYLSSHDIDWVWVSKEADHVLIEGNIDYYLGSTRWSNRTTGEFGYRMVSKVLE